MGTSNYWHSGADTHIQFLLFLAIADDHGIPIDNDGRRRARAR